MRVFVTGATGFVGSAVVDDLLAAGHQVLGLARSDAGAAMLTQAGAAVLRGDLTDLASLEAGAAKADGVIHTAFIHDWANFAASCQTDAEVIDAIGKVLADTGKPFVVTSGTALAMNGGVITEDLAVDPARPFSPRIKSELHALALAGQGVRASVVRLAPSVHGAGDHGFVPMLIALAKEKGEAAYIGDGQNLWPGVHRLDAARLFRLALESAPAGTRWHGAAEQGVPMKEIASIIGKRLGLPVVSKAGEAANEYFGWFSHFTAMNNPTSSAKTREQLGWQPQQPGLLADLDSAAYFG